MLRCFQGDGKEGRMKARMGKIIKLPENIREEFNQHLLDAVPRSVRRRPVAVGSLIGPARTF
jgi:hypothetical protein